ncbi:uncharacterized protein LOC116796382 [Chiroxiphia lanceolata]|uniref:uncharacterized protein LOC116796382 n=1 Tax=Chiroxiphia lanceolata TaxID=296741 RepID=UPI0013CF0A07|nr:uncharacterized protein LOC116796382 [Chiroxiphia lanceolata]XP_032562848.1 uncharacterized protein LOC116796382 [Chiroxiphia lanceolata]
MDSPHLMGLCFLLLAVAAPLPNIAMPSGDSAERTHDSSEVTVYYCKDCTISECESGSFVRFVKMAETENKGKIELVTRKTHILMCFQQGNTFSEGIYGIVWKKTGGFGYSCGILNSTAFSENGRGSISPEENKICCEAETNIWESNLTLKCHTEMSGAETRKAPAGILGEEIPGRRSNIVISLTFLLFLVACAGMVSMYCYRRHRNSQALRINRQASDEESLTHG